MNSKLILGTVQFGLDYGVNNSTGKPSKENIISILDSAYNSGIQLLDTAEAYGDSQNKIGEYHNNSTNKFNVITKFSSNAEGFSLNIIERVYNNLKILDVDKLYCYMFHSFDDFNKYFEKYRKDLLILKRDGIINNIGIYSLLAGMKVTDKESVTTDYAQAIVLIRNSDWAEPINNRK